MLRHVSYRRAWHPSFSHGLAKDFPPLYITLAKSRGWFSPLYLGLPDALPTNAAVFPFGGLRVLSQAAVYLMPLRGRVPNPRSSLLGSPIGFIRIGFAKVTTLAKNLQVVLV